MTDYISKTDLLLALAELPQDASKREVLSVIYDMPALEVDDDTLAKLRIADWLLESLW